MSDRPQQYRRGSLPTRPTLQQQESAFQTYPFVPLPYGRGPPQTVTQRNPNFEYYEQLRQEEREAFPHMDSVSRGDPYLGVCEVYDPNNTSDIDDFIQNSLFDTSLQEPFFSDVPQSFTRPPPNPFYQSHRSQQPPPKPFFPPADVLLNQVPFLGSEDFLAPNPPNPPMYMYYQPPSMPTHDYYPPPGFEPALYPHPHPPSYPYLPARGHPEHPCDSVTRQDSPYPNRHRADPHPHPPSYPYPPVHDHPERPCDSVTHQDSPYPNRHRAASSPIRDSPLARSITPRTSLPDLHLVVPQSPTATRKPMAEKTKGLKWTNVTDSIATKYTGVQGRSPRSTRRVSMPSVPRPVKPLDPEGENLKRMVTRWKCPKYTV
jgi:hypothetical protein